jgi:hypothetical protein
LEKQMRLDTGYYYAQVQNWSEENPDAFAGVHNMNGLILLMDEASGIPTPIWTVSKGFFTEPTVLQGHLAFSNPRRTDGAFFECFNKNRAYWDTEHIDSRSVEGTNPTVYQQIVDQYGEDSDPARVEVRGMFPEQAEDKFFSMADVRRAVSREPDEDHDEQFPLIMGIDVAGPGKDYSVVAFRQGRNAKILPWSYWKGVSSDQTVAKIAKLIDKYQPDAVFMDADGMGGPMVDNLRNTLRYRIITPVRSGPPATDPFYYDERTRCYAALKEWLKMALVSGALPLSESRYDTYIQSIEWIGRTWQWVDPGKEKEAIKTQLDYKIRSRSDVCRSMGRDFKDVVQEISDEEELMRELGISTAVEKQPEPIKVEMEQE